MFFSLDDGITKFTDLIQLVEFYQLNRGVLPCKLKHPCTMVALWPPPPNLPLVLRESDYVSPGLMTCTWLAVHVLCRHSFLIFRGTASTNRAIIKLSRSHRDRSFGCLNPLVNMKGSFLIQSSGGRFRRFEYPLQFNQVVLCVGKIPMNIEGWTITGSLFWKVLQNL